MMLKSVLLHPSYFPSVAQFHLMVSRLCVWEVSDNYQKQTLRNRTYIYGANGKQLLSVPVKHTKSEQGHQLFKDVKIENDFGWQKQHWKTLETAYRTSPYFEFYEDELHPLFEKCYDFLLDLDIATVESVLSCLQQDIKFEQTKTYQAKPKEEDFRFLTDVKRCSNLKLPEYYQIFSDRHGFLSNLSILDLLFHEGPNTATYLQNLTIAI